VREWAPTVLTMGTRWPGSDKKQPLMKRGGGDHSSTSGRSSGCGGVKIKRGMGQGGGGIWVLMGSLYRIGLANLGDGGGETVMASGL
jgi:hypothetical protein